MSFFSLELPPGIYRNGTQYQSKGRYYAAHLVRFQENEIKPVGGWRLRSSAAAFTGKSRAVLTWRDNSNQRWVGIGTHSKLYVQNEAGTNFDITPARRTVTLAANQIATTVGSTTVVITDNAHGAIAGDFVVITGATAVGGVPAGNLNATQTLTAVTTNTISFTVATTATSTAAGGGTPTLNYQITAGRADASQNFGYGGNLYGTSGYGVPRPINSAFLAATVWDLDTWGEHLIACSASDGKIYEWSLATSTPAAVVSGAPTACQGIVVTPERFVFALGASGNGRRVAWCDQEANTTWTPLSANQAGDQNLQTAGTLQCGRAMRGVTLLLTDVDAWAALYIGPPFVYGFQRVGSGCGVIAKGAVAARDSEAVWMGAGGFWLFDGQSVQPLNCDVHDYVFGDININQASKATAVHNTNFGEVWWFYPSGASNENDRYVVWAYRESQRLGRNIWTIGTVARLAGSGTGVFPNPLMVDAAGLLYEHEAGWSYDGVFPYLETGPVELGKGDFLTEVQRIVPDEGTSGDVEVTFYGKMWPGDDDTTYGPYLLSRPTDVLFQAREIRARYTGVRLADWRIGNFRLDVQRGDPI